MILAVALSTVPNSLPAAWQGHPDPSAGLAALQADSQSRPRLAGFLRVNFARSSDLFLDLDSDGNQDPGEGDLGGFTLDNARLAIRGDHGGWRYEVSTDFGGGPGTGSLVDAYASTAAADGLHVTLGQFRSPFLRSGLVSETRTLMLARTRNGIFYSVRTLGAMLEGEHEGWRAALAYQNGVDGAAQEGLLTARMEWTPIGHPGRSCEGSYGIEDDPQLVLGAAWSDDEGLAGGGAAWTVDAAFAARRWSLQAELVDYDDGYTSALLFPGEPRGDSTPFSLTAGVMLVPGSWEAALRYEDFDEDVLERELWTAGVNRYVSGHDIKWQLNYVHADKTTRDEDTFALGLTFAF